MNLSILSFLALAILLPTSSMAYSPAPGHSMCQYVDEKNNNTLFIETHSAQGTRCKSNEIFAFTVGTLNGESFRFGTCMKFFQGSEVSELTERVYVVVDEHPGNLPLLSSLEIRKGKLFKAGIADLMTTNHSFHQAGLLCQITPK